MGQRFPYVGAVFDEPEGHEVGFNVESCSRLEDSGYWHCAGTYIDLLGYEGLLAYSGSYSDTTSSGLFVITGGTGDFHGATGSVYAEFDTESGFTVGVVSLE